MRYVTLEALEAGELPGEAERLEMARHNQTVYARLREQYEAGAKQLLALLRK
jgi:hypothetical protein